MRKRFRIVQWRVRRKWQRANWLAQSWRRGWGFTVNSSIGASLPLAFAFYRICIAIAYHADAWGTHSFRAIATSPINKQFTPKGTTFLPRGISLTRAAIFFTPPKSLLCKLLLTFGWVLLIFDLIEIFLSGIYERVSDFEEVALTISRFVRRDKRICSRVWSVEVRIVRDEENVEISSFLHPEKAYKRHILGNEQNIEMWENV